MKKIYTKPYIVLESFQLDAAIASSCSSSGLLPLNYAMDSCAGPPVPGYFGDACASMENGTDITAPGADANDRICYHGPLEGIYDMYMNS